MKVKQEFIFHKQNTFGITSGNFTNYRWVRLAVIYHDNAITNKNY